jgi:predicted transcriptional regulator
MQDTASETCVRRKEVRRSSLTSTTCVVLLLRQLSYNYHQQMLTDPTEKVDMVTENARKATDAELDILNVLWLKGASTVREVHDAMTQLRDIGYTTTLKTLQVMTGKRLVSRDESSRAHVYSALVGRAETQRLLVGDLVDKVFGGSAAGLVAGALSAKKASPEDLEAIRRILDDAEEQK